MLKRILQLWWVILAGLLIMFSGDFWKFNVMDLIASIAIIIGAIFAFKGWMNSRKRKVMRQKLDKLIREGEWILARLTPTTNDDYDRKSKLIDDFVEAIRKMLKGTEYELFWEINAGLPSSNPEPGLVGLAQYDDVNKKYMANRLSRLKEIRDKLGD